jgi:FtsP/CotA-like multicopper oxidase with cupredoxin domain
MTAIVRDKKIGLGLLLIVALLLAIPGLAIARPRLQAAAGVTTMVCANGPNFDLQATQGYIQTPDGNQVYMWGFATDPGLFQMPGPVLCVNEGDTVTINLTNNLTEPVSIVFPGQMGVTSTGGSAGLLAAEATPGGGTVSYSFTASESGTNQHKQVHMGLYGTLVVRPALGANYAYNDPATEFDPDREYLLVFHEIDPDLHQAVEFGQDYNITTRHDRYWTINGRGSVDTLLDNFVPWLPYQPYSSLVQVEAFDSVANPDVKPALIRYANAGTVNHPFHPHGNTMHVVGRDGRPLGDASLENFTTTIGAGQTFDLLFSWDNVEGWTPGPNGNIPANSEFPFPGLQNLVFKDDVTFYGGDPYLGQKGELPTGVTSYNQCGEFYFPWHSHALNEIQNFDEGFGGMLTLVRVDPPGGCP